MKISFRCSILDKVYIYRYKNIIKEAVLGSSEGRKFPLAICVGHPWGENASEGPQMPFLGAPSIFSPPRHFVLVHNRHTKPPKMYL